MIEKTRKVIEDNIHDNTHIALICDEGIPENFLDEFCTDVAAESLSIQRITCPSRGPVASLEWLALLPFIALFILKPYFDGFMNEAGRDHYSILRKYITALWRRGRELKATVLTASRIMKPRYSIAFAVYTKIEDGRLVKLLIDENCSEEEFGVSIDAFVSFMKSYHKQSLDGEQVLPLNCESASGRIVLVEYDKDNNSLRVVDPDSSPWL